MENIKHFDDFTETIKNIKDEDTKKEFVAMTSMMSMAFDANQASLIVFLSNAMRGTNYKYISEFVEEMIGIDNRDKDTFSMLIVSTYGTDEQKAALKELSEKK